MYLSAQILKWIQNHLAMNESSHFDNISKQYVDIIKVQCLQVLRYYLIEYSWIISLTYLLMFL